MITSEHASEHTPADFGLDGTTWDDQHFKLSASYDATGSYTAANGVSYSTKQDASITSRWDSPRTFVDDGTGTDSGKATYATQFGSSWSNDVLASDQAANFPSRPAFDANGNPASLTAAPVAGTTFLTEAFDTGSSSGSASTTWAVAGGEDDNLLASALHSSYAGQRGSRCNYANTAAVADASGASRNAKERPRGRQPVGANASLCLPARTPFRVAGQRSNSWLYLLPGPVTAVRWERAPQPDPGGGGLVRAGVILFPPGHLTPS